MTDPTTELSPAGQQRKESILAMAKAHASQRRRRRRAAQTLATVIILGLLVPSLLLRTHHRQSPPVAVNVHLHTSPQIKKTISKSKVLVTRIETDPRIIERLAIPSQPPRWKKIGDDELLRDLASAHQPAGLVYVGDNKPVLLFRRPPPARGG